MELGVKVLKLPEDTIKAAMFDHRDSIQAATHKVLSKWRKEQSSGHEAYMNLLEGLKRAQMNQLAAHLRMWVGGLEDASQISDEA